MAMHPVQVNTLSPSVVANEDEHNSINNNMIVPSIKPTREEGSGRMTFNVAKKFHNYLLSSR